MITSSHQQQQEAGNSNNKQLVTQNGTSFLVLTDLKNSDAGNYSCSIKSEAIVYQLTVAGAQRIFLTFSYPSFSFPDGM
jgi:hypothetical protein